MGFVQIIEVRSDNVDELISLDDEWVQGTEGKRTARRSIVTTDRNDPTRHLVLVFFDSYESAMENSKLPETQEFAERFAQAADGPMTFQDLDVVSDKEL